MEGKQFNITPAAGVTELIIREATAAPQKQSRIFHTNGEISTPGDYLAFRRPATGAAVVEINRESKEIRLILDETDERTSTITGKMVKSPEIKRFLINSGKGERFTLSGLKDLLKANNRFLRSYEYEQMLKELSDLKIGAEMKATKKNDDRGNVVEHFEMKLKTNLAVSLNLSIPVFVGFPAFDFEANLCFDMDNTGSLNFWFLSPELQQHEDTFPQEVFDKEIARFAQPADADAPESLSGYLVLYVTK